MMYIQISHLAKAYAGQEVLRDVSFAISGRERVGLLGANGSGKSSLFRDLKLPMPAWSPPNPKTL